MSKAKVIAILFVGIVGGALVAPSEVHSVAPQSDKAVKEESAAEKGLKAKEEWAYTLAMQAYMYTFPAVNLNRYRHDVLLSETATNDLGNINLWAHERHQVTHKFEAGGSPNNDTLTSWGVFDLRDEPLIFEVPEMDGRYYTIQFIDAYINNFDYIGRRVTGTKAGTYALVGPGWEGKLPEGVARIDSTTPEVLGALRILIDGVAEEPLINGFQNQFTIRPLSQFDDPGFQVPAGRPELRPLVDTEDAFGFWAAVNREMTANPPLVRDKALTDQFRQIGIGAGLPDTFDHLEPSFQNGLKRAMATAPDVVTDISNSGAILTFINGWGFPPQALGEYGDDVLLRAVASRVGVAANSPEEAMYLSLYADSEGETLDGNTGYTMTFARGQQPPNDAFWSLTVYSFSNNGLVGSEINRYSVGDRTKGMQYGEDGSLTVYIQTENPGPEKVGNWLPTPAGPFYMLGRAYQPKKEMLNWEWVPPTLDKR